MLKQLELDWMVRNLRLNAGCGSISLKEQKYLAALEELLERRERDGQEPVAYLFTGSNVELPQLSFPEELDAGQKENCQALYAAPPAPVTLTEDQREQLRKMDDEIVDELEKEERACRAAVLKGG